MFDDRGITALLRKAQQRQAVLMGTVAKETLVSKLLLLAPTLCVILDLEQLQIVSLLLTTSLSRFL